MEYWSVEKPIKEFNFFWVLVPMNSSVLFCFG